MLFFEDIGNAGKSQENQRVFSSGIFGKNVSFLVDEYDVPVEMYISGKFTVRCRYHLFLFEPSLKANPFLGYAIITGYLKNICLPGRGRKNCHHRNHQ